MKSLNDLEDLKIPTCTYPLSEQPVENIEMVAGIYFRSILLKEAGTVIPQHSHSHDHATYVGSGKVRLWVDGKWNGDYEAGRAIAIKSGQRHLFKSLEQNTRLTCVHDMNSAALIKEV